MTHTLIARLLIMFTLLANFGWVADTYANFPDSDRIGLTSTADSHQNDDPADIHCHHCCHATAHLLTIPGSELTIHLTSDHLIEMTADSQLNSFIPALPDQPPRT